MGNVALVQVVNPECDLLPQKLGLNLCHLSVRFALQVAMQRATVDVLHDQEDLLVRLESLVQLREAVMVDFLHDFDLSLHALAPVGLKQLELFVYLDSDLLVQNLVQSNSHHSIRSLPNSLSNDVVVDVLDGAPLGAELVLFSR